MFAVRPPSSVTTIVIVAVPVCPTSGVTVTVRDAPNPPNTMFPSWTKPWSDDVPAKVNAEAADSPSPTVKAIAVVEELAQRVWFEMLVIVGSVTRCSSDLKHNTTLCNNL